MMNIISKKLKECCTSTFKLLASRELLLNLTLNQKLYPFSNEKDTKFIKKFNKIR